MFQNITPNISAVITFDGSSSSVVSLANNTITLSVSEAANFADGDKITYIVPTGTVIGNLVDGREYFVRDKTTTSLKLSETLNNIMDVTDPEIIQSEIYRIGREYQFEPMRDWFCSIYEVLLGQKDGPRFGSFVLIYGVENTQKLIMEALAGNYVRN